MLFPFELRQVLHKLRGIWLALTITLLAFSSFGQGYTVVQIGLSNAPFWQNPYSNRVIKLQPIQPFIGNYQWVTSDVTGNAYYSNSAAATYAAIITAPPGPPVNFNFTITATNLGLINVSNMISIPGNGIQTIPTGLAAWPIYVSDSRYAFNTNTPGQAPLSAFQTTNAIASAIPTNFWSSSASAWISNLVFLANLDTNQYLPGLGLSATTNSGPPGNVTFIVNTNVIATVSLLNVASNALASSAGVSVTTVTNITQNILTLSNANNTTIVTSNPVVFVNTNQFQLFTNTTTSAATTNANQFLYTNALPALTNGYTRLADITNVGTSLVGSYSNTADGLFALSNSPVVLAPLLVQDLSSGTAGMVISNASGGFKTYFASGSPQNQWFFQLLGYGGGTPTMGSNWMYAPFMSGNGGGGPAFGALSNAWTTNLTGAALIQGTNITASLMTQSNVVNTNGLNIASNAIVTFNSGTFVSNLNGFSTNENVVSSPMVQLTNESVGLITNLYQSTNLVHFYLCGSPNVTNSLYIWQSSLNLYTNFVNGGWLTNNGSVWQLFSAGGSLLFSHNVLNGPNAWTTQAGSQPCYSDYGFYSIFDAVSGIGHLLVNNVDIYTTITNVVVSQGGGSATNAIANLNGTGTNPAFLFIDAAWGTNQSVVGPGGDTFFSAALSGCSNSIASFSTNNTIAGGFANFIGNRAHGDFIGGGNSNGMGAGFDNLIVGGFLNGIGSQVASISSYDSILGGYVNTLAGSGFGISNSAIVGGSFNILSNSTVPVLNSFILGGMSNLVSGSFETVMGANITTSNNNTFIYSDGALFNSATNGTFLVHASNGVAINTNYPAGNALSVLGPVNLNGVVTVASEYSPASSITNLAIGGNTNFLQATNVINITQAGTSFCTNGVYVWSSLLNCYSNASTTAIISNNASQWILQTNSTTLYNSVLLVSNSWTAVSGSGTASSAYGYVHNVNGELIIGDRDIGTNASTSWNQTLFTPNLINATLSGQPNILFGQWQNITNPANNALVLTNTTTTVTPVVVNTNGSLTVGSTINGATVNSNTVPIVFTNAYYVLNTSYTNVSGLYAYNFGTPSGANGLYVPFGLVDGFVTFSNTSVGGNNFLIQSNRGTGAQNNGKWVLTNSSAATRYWFSPKTNQFGYPTNGNPWQDITATNPGNVMPLVTVIQTNNLFAISAGRIVVSNECNLETFGNDTNGFPGIAPFLTEDGANAFLLANGFSSTVNTLRIGPGAYPTTGSLYPMFANESYKGTSKGLTMIGVGPSSVGTVSSGGTFTAATNVCLWVTTGFTLSDLSVSNLISCANYADNPAFTNGTIIRCDLANTNSSSINDSIVFPVVANTSGGLYGFTAYDTAFYTAQDTAAGVISGNFYNCHYIGFGYPLAQVRDINLTDNRQIFNVFGGTAELYNTNATLHSSAIYVSSGISNAVLNVYGLNAVVNPINATNTPFFINGSGVNTNINGNFFANGTNIIFNAGVQYPEFPYGVILNPIVSGGYWTNTNAWTGTLVVNMGLLDSVSGDPGMNMTNIVTGEWMNATSSLAVAGLLPATAVFHMAPNDYLIATNFSSGSATATIKSSSFRP